MRENRRTELRFDARLASAGQRHSVTARVLGVVERIVGLHQPGGGGWHAGIQHGQSDADGELNGATIVDDLMLAIAWRSRSAISQAVWLSASSSRIPNSSPP